MLKRINKCLKCDSGVTSKSKSGLCGQCNRRRKLTPEQIKAISLRQIGNKNGIGKRKTPRTEEHKRKLSEAHKGIKYGIETINKRRSKMMGKDNPAWKGGITDINKSIRSSFEYKLWRTAVFERDGYKCVWCKADNKNGNRNTLNADHIKPFAFYPELRFSIDNGRTLCVPCHKKTDTFARKLC